MTVNAKGPELIRTARLELRKPLVSDIDAIFARYSGDPEVTRYMSWPTHRTSADTRAFLDWSDADWSLWPAGSYLVFSRHDRSLVGGTGLAFHSPQQASTGYVFAQDAWGHGYATESLLAMVELARSLGVEQLEAVCHFEHLASAHVLEKCRFKLDSDSHRGIEFPNLAPGRPSPVRRYLLCF